MRGRRAPRTSLDGPRERQRELALGPDDGARRRFREQLREGPRREPVDPHGRGRTLPAAGGDRDVDGARCVRAAGDEPDRHGAARLRELPRRLACQRDDADRLVEGHRHRAAGPDLQPPPEQVRGRSLDGEAAVIRVADEPGRPRGPVHRQLHLDALAAAHGAPWHDLPVLQRNRHLACRRRHAPRRQRASRRSAGARPGRARLRARRGARSATAGRPRPRRRRRRPRAAPPNRPRLALALRHHPRFPSRPSRAPSLVASLRSRRRASHPFGVAVARPLAARRRRRLQSQG